MGYLKGEYEAKIQGIWEAILRKIELEEAAVAASAAKNVGSEKDERVEGS